MASGPVDRTPEGAPLRVKDDPISLGTAPGNAIVMVDSTVSRHHAIIPQTRELGATNGTLVERHRIHEISSRGRRSTTSVPKIRTS